MPDLTALRRHERTLDRIERALLRVVTADYEDLRRALLDILAVRGVASLRDRLPASLAATRTMLRMRIRQSLDEAATQGVTSAWGELISASALVSSPLPNQDGIIRATAASRAALASAEADQALLWFEQVAGLLLTQAGVLSATQTPPAIAAVQLLASTGDRASVWATGKAGMSRAVAEGVWGTANQTRQMIYREANERSLVRYRKQAIATIDRRTTSCCLRVHSQIQDLDRPFTLTGTPRYGSEMDAPPFHYRCRTSIALYHESMEQVGVTTRDLHAAAQAEMQARLMGGTSQTRRSETALGELE